jgi:hypothetical protein
LLSVSFHSPLFVVVVPSSPSSRGDGPVGGIKSG